MTHHGQHISQSEPEVAATPEPRADIRINGIASLVYGVDDVAQCTRFFCDFGLSLEFQNDEHAIFRLPNRATVVLRQRDDPALPASSMEGIGVRLIVWGIDTQVELDAVETDIARDHRIERTPDGGFRFTTEFGVAMGIELFQARPVKGAPLPFNSTGNVQRVNTPRSWRERAFPKAINHVVLAIPAFEEGASFMRERLGFRLSDEQVSFGKYLRAGGCSGHHTLLLLNAAANLPGMDGKLSFHHTNFAVDDIDEIMVGANHMTRKGWEPSHFGLGRHRIDSALFYYLPCPAGGEAEYGADADCLDDSWVPRQFPQPMFAYAQWVHELPPFLRDLPAWRLNYLTEQAPRAGNDEEVQ